MLFWETGWGTYENSPCYLWNFSVGIKLSQKFKNNFNMPTDFFAEIGKISLKFTWKCCGLRITNNLKEKLEDLWHKTSGHCKSIALKHCGNQE